MDALLSALHQVSILRAETAEIEKEHGLSLVDSQNVVMLKHRYNATPAQVDEFIDLCRLVNHPNVYDFADQHRLEGIL